MSMWLHNQCLFITGVVGVGKSHLVNSIRLFLGKNSTDYIGTTEEQKVLVSDPTGVAAINIDGAIIHSGLKIPIDCRTCALPKLSDTKRCHLRNRLRGAEVIII